MSIPVDRGNQDQVKSKPAASKLKKKKKKPIPAKKVGRAVATPMKQAVKKELKEEEMKVEIPEPQFERIEFPEILDGATKEETAEIVEKYDNKVQLNQQKHNAEMKEWYKKVEMERSDPRMSDLEEDSDMEITEGFSLGYDAEAVS